MTALTCYQLLHPFYLPSNSIMVPLLMFSKLNAHLLRNWLSQSLTPTGLRCPLSQHCWIWSFAKVLPIFHCCEEAEAATQPAWILKAKRQKKPSLTSHLNWCYFSWSNKSAVGELASLVSDVVSLALSTLLEKLDSVGGATDHFNKYHTIKSTP